MSNALALPPLWQGRYPERVDDARMAGDRQLWRTVGTPFWSRKLAMRQADRFLQEVANHGATLGSRSDEQLKEELRALRRAFSLHGLQPHLGAQGLALVSEFSYRTLGLRPHRVQQLGSWAMLNGRVAEMDTGEGKTLAIALAAATAALAHARVRGAQQRRAAVSRHARSAAGVPESPRVLCRV